MVRRPRAPTRHEGLRGSPRPAGAAVRPEVHQGDTPMTLVRGLRAGGALALLLAVALPAPAAWDNAFQVTCFFKKRTESAYYAASPACTSCAPPCPCAAPCPCPTTTAYVQRTYYQPVTSYQAETRYEPVTSYRTSYYYEP